MSKPPKRAYLDTNVFVYGILEESNSRLVLFLAQLGEFEVLVSDLVIEEVEKFFRRNFTREAGYLAKRFVETVSTTIVRRHELRRLLKAYEGMISKGDLENLVAVRIARVPYLVSYDEDYEEAHVGEYITPKRFVGLFGLREYPTEY